MVIGQLAKEKKGVEKCLSKWEQHAEGSEGRESRTGRRKERIQCAGAWGTRRPWWVGVAVVKSMDVFLRAMGNQGVT